MILVAGGTGTLGSFLVHRLVMDAAQVRVLTRDTSRMPTPSTPGIETVTGDVRDPATLARACRGCTGVVSAVHGFTGARGSGPAAIDRDANLALIRASTDAGVEHLVLVSVHGAAADHPMSLHRLKYAAEQALAGSELRTTIVRPTPFLETWVELIGAQIRTRGRTLVFGKGDNPINFVSARDAADVIACALHHDRPGHRGLEVIGPEDLTFNQIAARLAATAEVPTRPRHIPLPVLRAISLLAKPVAPAFARQAQAAVVMNTTDMTAHDIRVQPTTLDEVIRLGRKPAVRPPIGGPGNAAP